MDNAAIALRTVIQKAKFLGVIEMAHKADPKKFTTSDIDKAQDQLSQAINDYSLQYLNLKTAQFAEELNL